MSKKLSTKKTKKTTKSKKATSKKSTSKKTSTGSYIYSNPSKTLTGYKSSVVRKMSWDVWVGGEKLGMSRKSCIESITIKETVEGSDSAVLNIADPNLEFIDDNIYLEDKAVKICMYWVGYTYKVEFNGYITAIDIDFGSDGIPTLQITCMDNTYRMNKKKVNKTFKKKTSAQVVQSICKKYGYKCVIQSGYKFTQQKTISQSNQSDIELITRLAQDETYPFTACLVGSTFYYVKQGKLSDTPKCSLTYRDYPNDIISFSPQINTETIESSTGSTNTGKKKSNTATEKTGQNPSKSSTKPAKTKTYTLNTNSRKWHKKTR